MPARKKHPDLRRRNNKTATRATLRRVDVDTTTAQAYDGLTVLQLLAEVDRRNLDGRSTKDRLTKPRRKVDIVSMLLHDDDPRAQAPQIPDHPRRDGWHPITTTWWLDVWASPMASEWDESDIHNLTLCALLLDDSLIAEKETTRRAAAAEFRLQRAELGLSPYSRRRLEWSIETAAEAKDRRTRRSGYVQQKPAGAPPTTDPRAHWNKNGDPAS